MKNFKIYTFLLGIIVGTIVFNVISVDFSFEDIYNIKINNSPLTKWLWRSILQLVQKFEASQLPHGVPV